MERHTSASIATSGTVDKALRVLEVLHQAKAPLALGELARALGIPKPTAHRLLASLLGAALVEQQVDGRYALGIGLVRLGLGALALEPIVRAAQLELERATRELGETFFLVKARAGRLVVLSKVEGSGMLRVAPDVGAEVPVDVTASGRLYMGFAPELLAGNPSARAVSAARVKRAVERGYDVNDAEWIPGLTVIAAPVSLHGELQGCVTCAGPSVRLRGAGLKKAISVTRAVAGRVSKSLGS
ncbi:MAG TPA: IclR family transcriptional regulator [Polyangiaceae bacterium]|jgi:DNA-binding IclR family transcriptional regulator|nr:IclR family transcriptional regulator [Polyangiaceae bacterium]